MPDPTALLAFIDALPDPHIVCDAGYRIVHANRAYLDRFGDGRDVRGRFCYEVSHHYPRPCNRCGESCPLSDSLASGKRERVVHLHHTPRGEEYVDIALTPIPGDDGGYRYFVERMSPLAAGRDIQGDGLIGRSPAFRHMLERLARVAPSDETVLLQGASGTGKELVAKALHAASRRAEKPFVTVDCTGLPENLIDSELFGHEKGAFTGAVLRQTGLVEAANGGTLFLDEIGDMPLAMQSKLLRLLETGTYRRLGSTEWRRADVRIVSATHHLLARRVEEGRFRADLYYRLSTFPLYLPPLSERREDIPLLAEALLARNHPDCRFSPAALARLTSHAFPGNIRELRNIATRCCLLSGNGLIDEALIEEALSSAPGPRRDSDTPPPPAAGLKRSEQARALGISERTLYRRLKQAAQP